MLPNDNNSIMAINIDEINTDSIFQDKEIDFYCKLKGMRLKLFCCGYHITD